MKHLYLLFALIATLFIGACGGGSTPAATAPAAPGGITVAAGNAQIQPSWTAVSGATSYNTYYGTTAGVTTANGIKITGAASGAAITGLTNGTTYYVAVTAVNATGESALSSEASATPVAPPAAPTGVTATGGNAQVTVTWPNVTGASSYNVYYGTTAGVTAASGTKITNATSGTAITGLTNGTTYYFVVAAANAGGESAVSSEVNAAPQVPVAAPAAPTGISATAGDTQVTINWTAVMGADSYNVYHGTAAGVTTANGTKVAGATSGSAVTGLVNGTAHYFVVTAVNVVGESVVSTEASATPQATATTFAMADLVGTWNRHRLQAGRTITDILGAITSVTSNWNHGIETWDASGNYTETAGTSSGGGAYTLGSGTMSISADGTITDLAESSLHGTMSASKDLVVVTRNAGNGIDPRMVIFQKQNPAITFTAADFAGTWNRHRIQAGRTFTDITTGTITSTTNNWSYGIETWDASGNYTETSGASSGGGAYTLGSGAMSISADGTITDLADPSLHGTMSASKDLVVVTRNAGNGIDPRMVIFQKQNPAITFTAADLAGTWNRHRLQAGRTLANGTTTNNWNYGVDTVDSSGNVTPGPELGSDGNTTPGTPSTWQVSANGIITDSGDASFHGTMSASKDLIVGTRTAGNGIDVRLIVYQRK